MPQQNVNGIKIYYEIHGSGEPLLLIMGIRRNIEWWYKQLPDLSAHYRVIVFDNRGSGRTDKPAGEYSIEQFADDTAGLMRSLGIQHAHVLGYSMGGYIAQELAITHPHMVDSLILVSTGAGGARAVTMSADRAEKFADIQGLTPEEILQKNMDIFFSDRFLSNHPDEVRIFSELSMRWYQPAEAFVQQFNACQKHDTVTRIHLIKAPTLILSGEDDPLIPPQNSMILKELMPQAQLKMFPTLRHCFFIEASGLFNQTVLSFLQSVKEKP
jgi:pimeloyl-ACP methyl ester carboxylesterase